MSENELNEEPEAAAEAPVFEDPEVVLHIAEDGFADSCDVAGSTYIACIGHTSPE